VSVPVGERRESRLEVFVQALDLVTYTLRITKNEKIFFRSTKDKLQTTLSRLQRVSTSMLGMPTM
jgi:hypothetical protein